MRTTELKPFAVGLTLFLLGGCTTLQNQSRVDPRTIAIYPQVLAVAVDCQEPKLKGDTRSGAINVKCLRLPTAEGVGEAESLIYNAALRDETARNRLASILIKHSDDVCTVEMGRLTANEAIVNTTLSTATTVLTTAASIVNGEMLQRLLTGGATVTNGTRDHVRAEVYRNLLTAQVSKAIRLSRARYLTDFKGRFGESKEEYNIDDVIRDANQYHGLCSFYVGLGLVDAAVSRTGTRYVTDHNQISGAINELGVRINALNSAIAKLAPDDASRAGLVAQRDALLTEQTTLYTRRAALAGADQGNGQSGGPAVEEQVDPTPPGNPAPATDSEPGD